MVKVDDGCADGFRDKPPTSPTFVHENELKRERYYRGGRAAFMAEARGYVMARKRGAAPFVISLKEWVSLPFVG